jgi:hypothetical protein
MTAARAYCGGIKTLEDLRQRCFIDPCGCWRWKGGFCDAFPRVWVNQAEGGRNAMNGRRASLVLAGIEIPKGHIATARSHCEHGDCVNPAHSKSGTKAAVYGAMARTGRLKTAAKQAAAKRTSAKRWGQRQIKGASVFALGNKTRLEAQ